jgi:hypothetical protein
LEIIYTSDATKIQKFIKHGGKGLSGEVGARDGTFLTLIHTFDGVEYIIPLIMHVQE